MRLCSYKVGKTLGQGTYAVVKEAVHIKTGQYYACKVISKRLMEGREHMVRNEIAALKKVSQVGIEIWCLKTSTSANCWMKFSRRGIDQ